MKKLFGFRRLEISIIKGFVFGIGLDREFVLFIGPFVVEVHTSSGKLNNRL